MVQQRVPSSISSDFFDNEGKHCESVIKIPWPRLLIQSQEFRALTIKPLLLQISCTKIDLKMTFNLANKVIPLHSRIQSD